MLSNTGRFFEEAYKILNQVYFENKLPTAMITLQSSPRSYAYITTKRVWTDNENRYYEINISTEYLNRETGQLLASLMHEMVHLYCIENGIRDTSRGGVYHNKRFKDEAEKRGLHISYVDKAIGYSATTPSDGFLDTMMDYGLLCMEIDHFRISPQYTDPSNTAKPKKKSSTRKYICTGCGISVRATKNVNIICADCGLLMVKVET